LLVVEEVAGQKDGLAMGRDPRIQRIGCQRGMLTEEVAN
jgi:hypothetical protein